MMKTSTREETGVLPEYSFLLSITSFGFWSLDSGSLIGLVLVFTFGIVW